MESVNSTPTRASGEPGGPMRNGTTYMVRPRIAPARRPRSLACISAGAAQLFVGPASSAVGVQMKVHCSTRATSFGFER